MTIRITAGSKASSGSLSCSGSTSRQHRTDWSPAQRGSLPGCRGDHRTDPERALPRIMDPDVGAMRRPRVAPVSQDRVAPDAIRLLAWASGWERLCGPRAPRLLPAPHNARPFCRAARGRPSVRAVARGRELPRPCGDTRPPYRIGGYARPHAPLANQISPPTAGGWHRSRFQEHSASCSQPGCAWT